MKGNDKSSIPTYAVKPGLKKTWPAFLLLIFALGISLFGWRVANEEIQNKIKALFDVEKSKITTKISTGIERQEDILKSFENLYKIYNVQVVRDVFNLFASVPTTMYDGIQSICYAPRVLKGGEYNFSELVRNEGYPNYNIKPEGIRDEYYPVEHFVPDNKKNSPLSSMDLFSDERRREAIEYSRDNNKITTTFLIPSYSTGEASIMLFIPIYFSNKPTETIEQKRQNIQGVVLIELKSKAFINTILGKDVELSPLAFKIYDGSGKTPNSLIYARESSEKPLLQSEQQLNIAGRKWIIEFSTMPGFGKDINANLSFYILAGGVILSFLLFGFALSLLTSRSRAIDLADRITRSQRRIVDSSQDLICVAGFDGKFRSMNPASKFVLGYEPHEMIGNPITQFTYAADKELMHKVLVGSPDETPSSAEARLLDKKGNSRWINWSVTSSNKDQMIYMIGRDITEKRKSDEKIKHQNKQLDLARIITDRENYKSEEFYKAQSLEFRTQLTSIVGFLEILLADTSKYSEEEVEFVNLAYASGVSLMENVKKVLDVTYAKISDVTFNLQQFRIDEVLNQVEKYTKSLCTAKGVNLLIKTPPSDSQKVNADPAKLNQALFTLVEVVINNHTEGNIRLKANAIPEQDFMEITLSDSGMHAAPAVISTIFNIEPGFEKRTLDDNEFFVFIAKTIIEVMNGTILLTVNEEGLTFTVRLPLVS
jgi:PAS domain S-box-containing protein